jgi:alpha-galactosidase
MAFLKIGIARLLFFLPVVAAYDVLHYEKTPNGFSAPPRGWNSFGLQTLGNPLTFDQDHVLAQCEKLTSLVSYGYQYCSLDSGWSIGDHGDDYGRVVSDPDKFPDMNKLADDLHSNNLKLGIYINVCSS